MSDRQTDKAIKSGIWYIIGNFATKAAGFVTTPLFTRMLSKTEVGEYSNFISWIELLTVFCTFDLYASVMLAKYDFEDELDDYIATNLCVGTTITLVFWVLSIVFRNSILRILNFDDWQLNIAFVYMAVYPALQMLLIKSRIFYKYKLFVALSLGSAIISTCVSIALTILCDNKLLGRIIGQYIPLIALNVFVYLFLLLKLKRFKIEYIKYGLAVAAPLIWHTLAGNILSISDRVMIREFCGSEATALYSVAYYCALIVSVLWSSMNNAWSPWAYDMMNSNNINKLRKASFPYVIFFGIVVFIFLLIGPELLLLMGGESYNSAVKILPIIMVSVVFQFVYSLYVNIEFFYKKQIYIAVGTSIAAIVNIVLNLVLIPKYGYIVAAYTTLIGYIVLFIVHFCFVKHLNKTNYYSTGFIVTVLLISVFLIFIVRKIYRYIVIRYFILAVLGIMFTVRIAFKWSEIKRCLQSKSIVGLVECLIGDFKWLGKNVE